MSLLAVSSHMLYVRDWRLIELYVLGSDEWQQGLGISSAGSQVQTTHPQGLLRKEEHVVEIHQTSAHLGCANVPSLPPASPLSLSQGSSRVRG